MIIAELKGKIPSKLNDKEDILTSKVFSFFKYSNRKNLKDYLEKLGLIVSIEDCKNAAFDFWMSYEDGTEPDLIIICGNYYLLFEAKLYSNFSPKTKTVDSQIDREIRMGQLTAKNLDKEFVYIALTAEYYQNKLKYSKYENSNFPFIWSNWQTIASFINDKLEKESLKQDKEFASDLFSLLVKKRLRSFTGLVNIHSNIHKRFFKTIFYNVKTSKFKGEFSGFIDNLNEFKKIEPYKKFLSKQYFSSLRKIDFKTYSIIFYHDN
jgi:hypothetical protein